MPKTIEAVLAADGRLHFVEEITLKEDKRVLVTFLEEEDDEGGIFDAAALAEAALAEDWNRPEEDVAWRHLQ